MTSRLAAELIVRAAAVRTMDPAAAPATVMAIRDGTITAIAGLIRERAAHTPPGRWIITAADWYELQPAEHRLPSAAELSPLITYAPGSICWGATLSTCHDRTKRGEHRGVRAVLLAAYDAAGDVFRAVTKCGAGFSDADLAALPARLAPLARPHGRSRCRCT
jgi:ATP dependent DNA ligase C terminal region